MANHGWQVAIDRGGTFTDVVAVAPNGERHVLKLLSESAEGGDPTLAAWGDRLEPGMKVIAVSRDLLRKGLTHRTRVRIEGLPGEYVVLDKMNKRWRRRIDIYMGVDREAALAWGVRTVRIHWTPPRS